MSLILSADANPGTAAWSSGAGSAVAHNVFGFDQSGGTILSQESVSCWCKTGAVNPVAITVGVAPTFAGQMLSFFLTADGGQDVVVTFPAGLNSANNTVVTMNDVRDSFVAMGVVTDYAPNPVYRWVIVANNGCTLS